MEKLDLREAIESKSPGFFDKYPSFLTNLILRLLRSILRMREINEFLKHHSDKKGFEFIDDLFDYLDFAYLLSSRDRNKIPYEGKLICVANHPLGGLDGLALLKAISSVRTDVKVVANDVLMNITNLKDLFLPFDIFTTKTQKERLMGIKKAIQNEEVVIFFPAAEVSRLTIRGIRDKKWMNGPIYFARKFNTPILPVFIKGRNSFLFYLISLINKNFSMFLLSREILKKRSSQLTIKVGDPIPSHDFAKNLIDTKFQTRLLRRHVYRIGKKKKGVFKTEKTIIHPVDTKVIKNELSRSDLLATTPDGKKLYLTEFKNATNVMREIFRLREVTFRKVGEGTGNKYDFDQYDKWYKHIVLWDDEALEIVGSYRLGLCHEIIEEHGIKGIYNASMYKFSDKFQEYVKKSVELGRSFIQQKYWRSNALDYLWQGIGGFLSQHPEVQYLFGAVSISDNYSATAKSLIVYFYKKWFGGDENLVHADNRFVITKQQATEADQILSSDEYNADFRNLKTTLKNLGYTVPVLFRKYSELCDKDGVKFLDFGVDVSFSNVVDGFVFLELSKLKETKKKRYYKVDSHS